MLKWIAVPLREVDRVKLGMDRAEVRKVLGRKYTEFIKSKFSKNTTDDFGVCHVFYDLNNRCEAVEVFDECEISVEGKVIFPLDIEAVKNLIPDLEEDTGSYISKSQSIGIYAPEGKAESILFGVYGYYE